MFLRRVVPGGASRSYGIDVARLAGLPKGVIARAREVMAQLEGGAHALVAASPQLSLLAPAAAPPSALSARLAALDIDQLTPLQALQLLAELKTLA